MKTSKQTFLIGGREYSAVRMNAFATHKLLTKALKIFGPVVEHLDINADVAKALPAIVGRMDDDVVSTFVFPMFVESRVALIDGDVVPIKGAGDVDGLFTAETLIDFYELAFRVAQFQLGPVFQSALARFGAATEK